MGEEDPGEGHWSLTGFAWREAHRHCCGANIGRGEAEVKTVLGLERWMQTRGLWRGRKRGPRSCARRMLRPLESSSRVSRDNLGEGRCDEVTGLLGLVVAGGVDSGAGGDGMRSSD